MGVHSRGCLSLTEPLCCVCPATCHLDAHPNLGAVYSPTSPDPAGGQKKPWVASGGGARYGGQWQPKSGGKGSGGKWGGGGKGKGKW